MFEGDGLELVLELVWKKSAAVDFVEGLLHRYKQFADDQYKFKNFIDVEVETGNCDRGERFRVRIHAYLSVASAVNVAWTVAPLLDIVVEA